MIKKKIPKSKKAPLVYLVVSMLCLLIFIIYNRFSHGVTSPYMTWLFAWPLVLGVIPATIFSLLPRIFHPGRVSYNIYNSAVAALTVSSLLKGVFDIAGNSSRYQTYLMIFGAVMYVTGILVYTISKIISNKTSKLSHEES